MVHSGPEKPGDGRVVEQSHSFPLAPTIHVPVLLQAGEQIGVWHLVPENWPTGQEQVFGLDAHPPPFIQKPASPNIKGIR